ncbi:transcription factor, contains a PHD finger motif [Geranomyces michiganensis]|nr:transcription factor, contains a PHD finger motif [Geranomyces michiganensis]
MTDPGQVTTASVSGWCVEGGGTQQQQQQHQQPLDENTVYNIKLDPVASETAAVAEAKPTKPKHSRADAKVCYCDGHVQIDDPLLRPPLLCVGCGNRVHQSCVVLMKAWAPENLPLLGDDFYHFRCRRCTRGKERLKRCALTWVEVTHLALFNLSHSTAPRKTNEGLRFYSWNDICQLIDQNWKKFWLKPRTVTWENTVASCLSTHKQFIAGIKQPSHDQGLWALSNLDPPSHGEHARRTVPASDIMIIADGSLQPFARAKAKRKRTAEETENIISGNVIDAGKAKKAKAVGRSQSNTPLDEASKAKPRKRLKKTPAPEEYIDPATAIELYRDVDNPREPVMMSQDTTHRARQVNVTDGLTVTTDAGYCMAKATHGVWEGKWYYEAIINDHPGHTRIGWSQISGDLQAPCGYDQFSFGFRDSPGTLFHQSHRKKDMPEPYAAGYGPGDVLGMSIDLPVTDSIADLLPRLWDRTSPYMPFRSRPLTIAQDSEIRFWRNGECLGVAFRDIPRGKYHPAISLYRGASVTLNFGPEFRYAPPEGYRPLSASNDLAWWSEIAGAAEKAAESTIGFEGAVVDASAADTAAEVASVYTLMEMDDENATPGPTSSPDGEADDQSQKGGFVGGDGQEAEEEDEEDEDDEEEDDDDDDLDVDTTSISPSIAKLDPDDVSGVAALLSLATAGANTGVPTVDRPSGHSPHLTPPTLPVAAAAPPGHTLLLALEIDKKEAEVVDLIRRSSLDLASSNSNNDTRVFDRAAAVESGGSA